MTKSNDLFGSLLGLGMAGLMGYGAYKGVEYLTNSQREAEEAERNRRMAAAQRIAFAQRQQEESQRQEVRTHLSKMDSAVNQLLESPEQAVVVVRDCVCDMDETNWQIFAALLANKMESHPFAKTILAMAHYTREAGKEIAQLISHSVDEAVSLVHDIWNQKDEAEQAGFLLALQAKAKSSVRAKAILGRLSA